MAIRDVKVRADLRAEQAAVVCRGFLLRNPATIGMAATVVPNFKFYRRMAGLRGGDLRKE